jgi:hypothetical protein
MREEQVPLPKPVFTTAFGKHDSVFTLWKEDINPTIQACLDHDIKHCFFKTFTRNQMVLEMFYRTHFVKLKQLYITALSNSSKLQGVDLKSMVQVLKDGFRWKLEDETIQSFYKETLGNHQMKSDGKMVDPGKD